jgi:hypothetical protein
MMRLALIAALLCAPAWADWLSGYDGGRVKITIESDDVSEAVPFFPVYLSDMPAAFWTALDDVSDTTGATIRATTAAGDTEVAMYVGSINTGGETGVIFVRATGLSTSVDTDYYIYGGDSTASMPAVGATYGRNAVFAGYSAVYLPGMTTTDLTGGGYNLTASGSPGTAASGIEGITAATYNGSPYHYYNGTPGTTDWPITLEAISSSNLESSRYFIFALGSSTSDNPIAGIEFTGNITGKPIRSLMRGGSTTGSTAATAGAFTADTTYFISATRDANTGTSRLYVNGAANGTDSTTIVSPTWDRIAIGALLRSSSTLALRGTVSLAAMSSSARSANYMATMHKAWTAGTFLTASATWETNDEGSGTTGWVVFQSSANTSPGGIAWSNTANALVDNSNFATSGPFDDDGTTQTLRLTNPLYGTTIPTGADTYTVSYRIRRATEGEGTAQDLVIRPIVDGSLAGDNLAKAPAWPESDVPATAEYTATGLSVGGADFDADFGLAIQADVKNAAPFDELDARVYYAEVKVDWGPAPVPDDTTGFFVLLE